MEQQQQQFTIDKFFANQDSEEQSQQESYHQSELKNEESQSKIEIEEAKPQQQIPVKIIKPLVQNSVIIKQGQVNNKEIIDIKQIQDNQIEIEQDNYYIQSRDNTKQLNVDSNQKIPLTSFFNSYSMFVNETSNIILDLNEVLLKLQEQTQKYKPPDCASQQIDNLWVFLKDIDQKGISELSQILQKLPQNKLFDTIQNLEKLYIKLMIEYNVEVKRGKQLGIIKSDTTI